jgi:cobalt-zinc-cadmium efflux system membrane fusion protein
MTPRTLLGAVLAACVSATFVHAVVAPKLARVDEHAPDGELWVPRDRFEKGLATVAAVQDTDLPQAILAGGRIDFDDMRVTHVFSPVSGRVTRVLVRLGQPVQKGTALAEILSPDLASTVSDEVKARADLAAAERDWERQKKLLAVNAAAARDYENAEDTYDRAKAEEERASQRLTLLKSGRVNAVTQEYELASQIEGRVIARMANPGVEVQGQFSGGTAVELFTVGKTDNVWLYADIAQVDLPGVRPGVAMKARVLAYPDTSFEGKVEWVSSTLDPQLRTARVRCALANPDGRLKPQMFAAVRIDRPSIRGLAVPRNAVVRINDHSFVYVQTGVRPDGRLVFGRRQVTTPDRAGAVARQHPPASAQALLSLEAPTDLVQILGGVSHGEKVLVDDLSTGSVEDQEVSVTAQQFGSGKITLEAVREEQGHDTINIGGRLTFDDLRVSHVFPPVGGRVTQVVASPGDVVRQGAVLAVIQSPDVGNAFSDMLKAKADLVAAEHELKRQRELADLNVGVRRDLEVAEDNASRCKAEYERAEQLTRLLRQGAANQLSQEFVLRSPIDGEITARAANPGLELQGQYSGGSNVVELFTIGETDPIWLLGDVYEMDLPHVKIGDEITLQPGEYPGQVFRGAVDWISDVLDPVMRTAKVRCVLPNPNHLLRPEMYEMATLSVPARRGVSVPREALIKLGDRSIVFVAGGTRSDGTMTFRCRTVVAQEQLPGGRVPVLSGLQPGDRIAAQGAILLAGLL